MKRTTSTFLAAALALGASAAFAQFDPTTSPLFERHVDPYSGVVSYLMRKGAVAYHEQGMYFVHHSLTDDGRYLVFDISGPELQGRNKTRRLAVADLKTGRVTDLGYSVTYKRPASSVYVDAQNDCLYGVDATGLCRIDFTDPEKRVKICDIPANLSAEGTIRTYGMHLTLSADRTKAFLDTHVTAPVEKWVQGCIDIPTKTWEKWGETYYELAHGQLNPVDPTLALCALQPAGAKPKAPPPAGVEYVVHTSKCARPDEMCNRIHFVRPGRPVDHVRLVPGSHATHEVWAADGKGIFYCDNSIRPTGGVWYQSLADRRSVRVCPEFAQHAGPSASGRYIVYDRNFGGSWKGGPWKVGFWNRETNRKVYIHTQMEPLVPQAYPSTRHADPHPHFVMDDRYIVSTYMDAGQMRVSITPVDQLIEKTTETASVRALADWPEGSDPKTVAARVTDQLLATAPEKYRPEGCGQTYGGSGYVMYNVVSLWANALACADRAGDAARKEKLLRMFEPFYPGGAKHGFCSPSNHVDYTIFGALPLEVYRHTKDERALRMGLGYADFQWAKPDPAAKIHPQNLPFVEQDDLFKLGFSPQSRFWIDDMYMMTFLQVQAWRATHDEKYIDRMCTEAALYICRLQRPDGLFDHAPGVPFVWGRGDGWVAGGLAMLMEETPFVSHELPDLMRGYLRMMAALAKWQRPSGLWGQLVDDPASWDETSGSAMFAYALAVGVKLGVLDAAEYAPRVRKAYLALVSNLDAHGNLGGICDGTVKKNDRNHYLNRPKVNGAPYGQAAMLWLCGELMR